MGIDVVIFMVLWFLLFGWFWLEYGFYNAGEAIGTGVMMSILSGFGSMIVCAVIALSPLMGPYKSEVKWSHDLVALSNTSAVSGSFFLGSGTIGEDPAYQFVKREGDGYVVDSIPTHNTVVHQNDDEKPRIERITDYRDGVHFSVFQFMYEGTGEYHIYVPEGAIWTGYEIDVRE